MEAFKVYTELDSLMDFRRATLERLLEPSKCSFDAIYGETYGKRRVDDFERPEQNITQSDYLDLVRRRDNQTLLLAKPNRLLVEMFGIIVDFENLAGRPLEQSEVELTINIWPYDLSEELLEDFRAMIMGMFAFKATVNFVTLAAKDVTLDTFKHYTHVFSYMLFNTEEHKNFQTTIQEYPNPNLKIFVPDIINAENEISPLYQPEDIKMITGAMFSPWVTILPLPHHLFDAKNEEVE